MNQVQGFTLFIISFILISSCSMNENDKIDFNVLSNLPVDTGGAYIANPYKSTGAPYGHYIYTPSAHIENGPKFPLLVFLHGSGEKGNSSVNPEILDIVLKHGPPKLIEKGEWNPAFPMIVASPQCHDGGWNAEKIHGYLEYLIDNYQVNKKRIYVTGLSMGGYGTFSYIGNYGENSYVAACVPICGGGSTGKADNFLNIPIWAFHGDADGTVSVNNSINMINAINALNPLPKAKLTIYPGVGHDSWSMTYDGTGMGSESSDYNSFNQSIYDWMFKYYKE